MGAAVTKTGLVSFGGIISKSLCGLAEEVCRICSSDIPRCRSVVGDADIEVLVRKGLEK
jgi:hypothetical protein